MKVIGLTGGIGMGKSFAASVLRRAGVPVFDADATVHRLQATGGRALPAIAAAFPGTVTGGVLDRAALRAVVLADHARLRVLERILHPLVRAEQRRFLARARAAGRRLAVLDIPLLFETGGDRQVDRVMVVSAPLAIQLGRVRRRRRMSEAEIRRVIGLQMPDAAKRRRADVVIRTGLSRYHAQRAIRRFVEKERSSFLKKRTKKLLRPVGWQRSPRAKRIKVFWFFFSKKNFFLPESQLPAILFLTENQGDKPIRILAEHIVSYAPINSGTIMHLSNRDPIVVIEALDKIDAMLVRAGWQRLP
jgi:dephospho-CoA kinase